MTVPIPGHELTIDSTGALNLERLPRRMVVMGGGVIGLELASAFACYGTEITIIEMLPSLLPRDQKEAANMVVSALKSRGSVFSPGLRCCGWRKETAPAGGL